MVFKQTYSLTSPYGHLYYTDISLLRTVLLVPLKFLPKIIHFLLQSIIRTPLWSGHLGLRFDYIKYFKQNTAMLIVLRENELCKISTRLRKNSKQSGIRAIDSWFDIIVAHQYLRRNKQREELCWKITSLSIRRLWGKRGKIEAKKGESPFLSLLPGPIPPPPSKICSPLAP